MLEPHTVNVWTHIVAGGLALAVGAVPLVTPKGGPAHRRFGRLYAIIAAVSLGTALIGDVFFNPPPALVAATLAATYQYLSGLRALQLRVRGPGWADALLALAGLGACAVLFAVMGPGTPSWSPAIGYSTIGYIAAVSLYDLSRPLWRRVWLAHARPLDHGLKLTGAYFAMMSAGVGNVFRALQPWSQVGPSMLGMAVMVVLAILYFTRRPPLAVAAGA
jgi:hypothetical protein